MGIGLETDIGAAADPRDRATAARRRAWRELELVEADPDRDRDQARRLVAEYQAAADFVREPDGNLSSG